MNVMKLTVISVPTIKLEHLEIERGDEFDCTKKKLINATTQKSTYVIKITA